MVLGSNEEFAYWIRKNLADRVQVVRSKYGIYSFPITVPLGKITDIDDVAFGLVRTHGAFIVAVESKRSRERFLLYKKVCLSDCNVDCDTIRRKFVTQPPENRWVCEYSGEMIYVYNGRYRDDVVKMFLNWKAKGLDLKIAMREG